MKFISLNSGFDYKLLSTINGVKFTNRQIDAAACLIGRQKYKEIGRVLSISSSTVDEHLKKIKAAIRSSSVSNPTGLLEFFERSDLYKNLKLHYVKLFTQYYFEEILAKMAKHGNSREKCLIKYHANIRKHNFINKKIREHLILAGISFDIGNSNESHNKPEQKIIYIIPSNIKAELDKDCDKYNFMIYLTQEPEKLEKKSDKQQNKTSSAYYKGFFELLNVIYKDVNVEQYSRKFHDKKMIIENNLISDNLPIEISSLNKKLKNSANLTQRAITGQLPNISIKQNVKSKVIYGTILLLTVITILVLGVRKNTVEVITSPKDDSIVFNLPRPLDYYTPRVDVTKAIWNILTKGNKKTAILAGLHGLGGIGKTTLALNAIHHPNQSYEFRGWFRAETKELLKSDYLELGEDLHLFSKETPDETKIKKVRKWLNNKQSSLLVYDNAPDLETLNDYLPNNGYIIITSRNYKLPGAIEVDIMTEFEALNLLNNLISDQIIKDETYNKDAKELIKELGYLPLAISQAGAYISSHVISVAEYLKLYKTEKHYLLSENIFPPGDLHEPVYVTWNINVKHIQQHKHGKDALKLLDFISICYPEDIPRKLLIQYLYGKVNSKTELEFNKVLNLLKGYSFIKTSLDVVSMHRLVHCWIKDTRSKEDTIIILKKGIKAIETIYPWNHKAIKDISFVKLLVTHVELILSQSQSFMKDTELIDLQFILGDIYFVFDDYLKASQMFKQILSMCKSFFGDDNIITAKALYYFGHSLAFSGTNDLAKYHIEKAIQIQEKHYGEHHVSLIRPLCDLANVYRILECNVKAQQLVERALNISEKNYGKTHIETAYALRHLGKVYRNIGKYLKGAQILERALVIEEQIYGYNHIETAFTLQYLTWMYINLGECNKAKIFAEKNAIILEKHYGTHKIRFHELYEQLSWVYLYFGDYVKAKQFAEKALAINQKHYGTTGLNSAYPLYQLARVYLYLGDYVTAKDLSEKSLAILTKFLEEKTEVAADLLKQLGWIYIYMQDYPKAKKLFEQALSSQIKVYGKDNIETIFTTTHLGSYYCYVKNYLAAKELITKSSNELIKRYGIDNDYTLFALANLGNVHRMLGEYDKSRKLLEQSIDKLQKKHGENSYLISKIIANLGLLYGDLGNEVKKQEYLQRALMIFKQHFPPGHMDIKKAENELNKVTNNVLHKNGIAQEQELEQELGYLIDIPD